MGFSLEEGEQVVFQETAIGFANGDRPKPGTAILTDRRVIFTRPPGFFELITGKETVVYLRRRAVVRAERGTFGKNDQVIVLHLSSGDVLTLVVDDVSGWEAQFADAS